MVLRNSILFAAATLAALVMLTAARPAEGAVKIYETSEEARLLGKIKAGNCRVRRDGNSKYFRASARSTNRDFRLELTILKWDGYGKQYDFKYGTNKPGVFYLGGPGGPYSNIFLSEAAGIDSGGVGFSGRSRMSMGMLPTPNESGKRGVVLAGAMRC